MHGQVDAERIEDGIARDLVRANELTERLRAELARAPAPTARPQDRARPPVVRVGVAGRRDRGGDTGPGPGVWQVLIHDCVTTRERRTAGTVGRSRLLNPFPMGMAGVDENRRALSLELYDRWLREVDVRACDMTMEDGTAMPYDVEPQGDEARALTGRAVLEEIRMILQIAQRRRDDAVRFYCTDACRCGARCHGEHLARIMRSEQQAEGMALPAHPRVAPPCPSARSR